jgi:hypothetical protein
MYIRKISATVKSIRQQAKDRRDFLVLKRVFILLSILIASGVPTLGISLFFQFFGYLPYWSTQFQWLTATFSICVVSIVLIFVSPNLPKCRKHPHEMRNVIFHA